MPEAELLCAVRLRLNRAPPLEHTRDARLLILRHVAEGSAAASGRTDCAAALSPRYVTTPDRNRVIKINASTRFRTDGESVMRLPSWTRDRVRFTAQAVASCAPPPRRQPRVADARRAAAAISSGSQIRSHFLSCTFTRSAVAGPSFETSTVSMSSLVELLPKPNRKQNFVPSYSA